MTIQEAEEIKQLFLSKAPESHYYIPPIFNPYNGVVNYSAGLFTGYEDTSIKIAGLSISTMIGPQSNGEIVVELFIHDNSYRFLHNPELCKEIIERFIPIQNARLGEYHIQQTQLKP